MCASILLLFFNSFFYICFKLYQLTSYPYFSNFYFLTGFICMEMFSLGTPVSFANKTDRHDITEILFRVALNTIALTYLHGVRFFYGLYQSYIS